MPAEYIIHSRVWGKGLDAELMQRTQGASSSGQCKLQGGPRPPGTWRWGLGALGDDGTRRGHQAVRLVPSCLMRRGCSERPLIGASSVHLLRLVPYWESLHRSELLPCWSAAGWRPPASCRGYRMPWALEPPSWMGGCPSNWVVTASEA